MDNCTKRNLIFTQGRSEISRSSTVLSVLSMLLTIALLVRIETVTSETRMIQAKFSEEIQQVKEALKDAIELQAILSEDLDASNGAKDKRKIVRRSVNINSSVSKGEEIRDAIKRYVTSIVMDSFCLAQGRVCASGPPGPKGVQGPRGKRGQKGKKGTQGIMGPPGEPGKQGMMGDTGAPGVKGEKGSAGNPGHPGTKGEPGESISAPVISVTPPSMTVMENQTATFFCSAAGNPKPEVAWSKTGGGGSVNRNVGQHDKLEIKNATYHDAGRYVCKATNVLGQVEKVVELFVEVPPRFTKVPDGVITVIEDTTATIVCRAFGFPPPVIQWSKAFSSLPQGRSTVVNGTLTISQFSLQDIGSYQCEATNKLGSVTTATALRFQTVCPHGWVGHGGFCYTVIDTPTLKWNDARKTCQNLGADLPIIRSANGNAFVFNLIKKQKTVTEWGVWLGLKRLAGSKFYWMDSTPLAGHYSAWASGEPNNPQIEKCGHMYGGRSTPAEWNDINCDILRNDQRYAPVILCQKPKN